MSEPRVVRLVHEEMPVTLNVARQKDAGQWGLRKELQKWRLVGFERATRAVRMSGPMTPPVRVVVHHYRKNRAAMPDTGAPILAAKAMIDGAVDAGLLPSDRPEVVTKLTFLAPEVVGRHGLGLVLIELPRDGALL
jgi:hypothetical protein